MRIAFRLFTAGILLVALAAAQQSQPQVADAQQICAREFGEQFKLDPKFAPFTLDLDGDGREDLVLVTTAKNPLAGELDYHYRAIDPYDAYFGFGDPKVTAQFTATNATTTRYVLVLHNWRAPKAKFVIINLPFDSVSAGSVVHKKKTLPTIHAIEPSGGSDVYWDGKKYRWEPTSIGAD